VLNRRTFPRPPDSHIKMLINSKRHITEDCLELYLLHRLNARLAEEVEEHLLFCPKCLEASEHLDVYLRSMCSAMRRFRGIKKVMTAGRATPF
jgi:hypothetical protein